jgi:hypothetical protein
MNKIKFTKSNKISRTEVFRVLPAYQKVSAKRKIAVLKLMIKWCNDELDKLSTNKKS